MLLLLLWLLFAIVVSVDRVASVVVDVVDLAALGDIVAIVGARDVITGDTLCDPSDPIVFESLDSPDPVIFVAIEPKKNADAEHK